MVAIHVACCSFLDEQLDTDAVVQTLGAARVEGSKLMRRFFF